MKLTSTEVTALEFFEENLAYVESFGLTNLERSERRLFTAGKEVAERVVKAAKAAARRR